MVASRSLWLGRLTLLGAALVGNLLLIELGFRLWGPSIEYVPRSAQVPDPELGYALEPGYDSGPDGGRYGCRVQISSQGLRDDPYAPRGPGEARVLVLGDSFSLPQDIPREEVYLELLEQRLQRRFPERQVSVLNTGVPSYATFQEEIMLARHGPAFEPDIVLLQYCPNDLPVNLDHTPEGVAGIMRRADNGASLRRGVGALAAYSHAVRWLALVVYQHLTRLEVQRRSEAQREVLDRGRDNDAFLEELCLRFVGNIRRRSEELGAALVVLVIRYGDWEFSAPKEPAAEHFLVQYCEREGIPYLTMSGIVEASGETWERCIEAHFTPHGHQVVAAQIEQLLVERGLTRRWQEGD